MADSGTSIGPFADTALALHACGLAPIPCAADGDGKTPLIAFGKWRHRPGASALHQMIERFHNANVGIVTGLSNVTIADIDDPDLFEEVLRRFGETPMITQTPSGGIHLWYRSLGERNRNLRHSEGLPVDIVGKGGILIVPPSVRPEGQYAGRRYSFQRGTWDEIANLPPLRSGSLPNHKGADRPIITVRGSIPEGRRNDTLFRGALKQVAAFDCLDDLRDKLHYDNQCCVPPLPDNEVDRIAESAWRIECDGKNLIGRGGAVFTLNSDIRVFQQSPCGADAALLLLVLRCYHFDGQPFAISPTRMAAHETIFGWSHHRYRTARAKLIELGMIEVVHEGGKGSHDPKLFRFTQR